MASFEVEALFTNLLMKLLIFVFRSYTSNIIRFRNLLELANKVFLCFRRYLLSTNGWYGLLGHTLANIFLCHYEEIWIVKCPKQFKPKYYQRFVDDVFLLFDDSSEINKFEKYMHLRNVCI